MLTLKENDSVIIPPFILQKDNSNVGEGESSDSRIIELYNDSPFEIENIKIYIDEISPTKRTDRLDVIKWGDRYHFLSKGFFITQNAATSFIRTGVGTNENNPITITINEGEIAPYSSINITIGINLPNTISTGAGKREFKITFKYEVND